MMRVLAAVGLVAAVVGLGLRPAEAAHTNQPMLVEINTHDPGGYDLTARFSDWEGQCTVDIERWVHLQGTMQPPVAVTLAWTFDTPSGVLDGTNCPDTGELVDLNGNGARQVVAGWSEGPPPGVGGNLMIIGPFVVPCGYPADCMAEPPATEARVNVDGATRPSFLGGGQDFDGDGSVDVYEVDSESSEVVTLLNQGDGTLIEGPMGLPGVPNGSMSSPTDGVAFGDFDGDGAMDLAADYQFSSDPARPDGVAVVLDDGTHVQLLERDEDPTRWSVTVVDEDLDGNLDVRAKRHGNDVRLFLGDGTGGFELATCLGWTANVVGTAGPDILAGTEGPDVIVAFGGDDYIGAEGGADLICAGAGNDVIDGSRGGDIIVGGSGNDVIAGGDGADFIVGGDGADYIGAGPGDDVVHAGAGLDTVYGGAGEDRLNGGDDADYLGGGSENDWLVGGPGNDSLIGGAHVDDCSGGAGTDTFRTCETAR